jgi:hypothetical protein
MRLIVKTGGPARAASMTPERQALRAARPEGQTGMTRASSAAVLVAILAAMPAAAGDCPHGQFYRVRLHQCVGLNTRLAWAYVHVAEAPRLATPRSRADPEAEAKPIGESGAGVPFVLPLLNDWPTPK